MNTKSKLRSEELTHLAEEFYKYKIKYLEDHSNNSIINHNKQKLLEYFQASEEDWKNWEWQMKNRVNTTDVLKYVFNMSIDSIASIEKVSSVYRWSVTPYYLSQIRLTSNSDPFFLQAIPSLCELETWGSNDPMGENFTNPAGAITRRYPDRAIINITNSCPSYCRHCQRRRNIGTCDFDTSISKINDSILYIKEHPEIRDVLVTGGDALTLSDKALDKILWQLNQIPSIEIIRIGTRTPVTLPQRITPQLVKILKTYSPIYINTQFNHPLEITEEASLACKMLVDAGIVMGNQMVFLKNVNNNLYTVQLLNQLLLETRIRPYYIFHPKNIIGTHHFYIPVSQGLEIVKGLRGNTSGLAIPTYVYNSENGNGKIPLSPECLAAEDDEECIYIETWEGKKITIDKK